jgi:hypothetical protein
MWMWVIHGLPENVFERNHRPVAASQASGTPMFILTMQES